VRHCISLAGVLDLRRAWELHLSNDAVVEFLGGTPEQVPEHYREASPMALKILRARQVIVHGLADDSRPRRHQPRLRCCQEKTRRAGGIRPHRRGQPLRCY
jgi:hypothetical protein